MSLGTYTDLVTAVGDWLDRDDLAARVPDFVRLTEARLNRTLEDPDMEQVSETLATGTSTALPDDFGSMVSITTGQGPLAVMGPVEFAGLSNYAGVPRFYTISDGTISFAPANATASIRMLYRRSIPPLSADNPTNWLLTRAPDLYLYGALLQASAFLSEDERLPLWKGAFDEALGELRSDGAKRKWGAGAIAPRIMRP